MIYSSEDIAFDMETFRRKLLIFASIGIFVISLLSAGAAIIPLYRVMENESVDHLVILAETRSERVTQFLNLSKATAALIASRTRTIELLSELRTGQIDSYDYNRVVNANLLDALSRSTGVLAVSRFDIKDRLVNEIGRPVPSSLIPVDAFTVNESGFAGPAMQAGQLVMTVSAPIIDRAGNRVGTDILLLEADSLFNLARTSQDDHFSRLRLSILFPGQTGTMRLGYDPLADDGDHVNVQPLGGVWASMHDAFAKNAGEFSLSSSPHIYVQAPTAFPGWSIMARAPESVVYSAAYGALIIAGASALLLTCLGVLGVIFLLRPVTETAVAHAQAMESYQSYLNAIVDNISDGIAACDAKGALQFFNRTAKRYLTLPEESLQPENWPEYYSVYHADGKTPMEPTETPLYRALHGEVVKDASFVLAPKNQPPLHFLASGRRIENSTGETLGAVVSMHDITENLESDRALYESEQRFRSAFDSAGHGIALIDLDGRWLKVNNAVCRITGYSEEELLKIDFQTITHPDDLEDDMGYVAKVLSGELPNFEMEKRYRRPDGSYVSTILCAGLVRDLDGEPLYFVSQIVDISKWKDTEAQLIQSQKMEAVGQLTGGVAHDFNNILAIILGNLQLLQRRIGDDPKMAKMAATAISAAQNGAGLTRQLLAFSRRQELNPESIAIADLISGMDNILSRTLGEDIKIFTRYENGLANVKVDRAQLESTILNLAINARDVMPDGGQLTIEASNETLDESYTERYPDATPGDYVCISVKDTGPGIPEDMRQRIFEPFFTTKPVGKGTGLGLSMVFGFIRQSNGHINVYSEEGKGAQFRIYLPQRHGNGDRKIHTKVDHATLPRGTETILLVEDDEELRETTALLLEDLGYMVISEADGPSALATMDAGFNINVDLLFTDMIMPGGMNGHDLALNLAKRFPDMRVLLTSGYPRDAFAEGREFDLLQKPYTQVDLATSINALLTGKGENALLTGKGEVAGKVEEHSEGEA